MIANLYSFCRALSLIGFSHICPICKWHFRKLETFGLKKRLNAECPRCGSLERSRLLWMYLKEKTNFFTDSLKVLEIAPIEYLQNRFKKMNNLDYVSIDIISPIAMMKMDITNINLPDNQFNCIICYHVLEHIIDDQKAMGELFRVLKPGGWAIIQSPIDDGSDKTYEDPKIISFEDRERIFGQKDHVRIYGKDYKERLEQAGFVVKVDDFARHLDNRIIKKYCLPKNEDIYICTKTSLLD